MFSSRRCLVFLAALSGGCSSETSSRPPAEGGGIQLTSELRGPHEVVLAWRDTGPPPAGRIVEFATEPSGQYTTIDHLPPSQMTFTHSQLIPDTNFFYRIRPFYGPASASVEMHMPPPPPGEDIDKDHHEWAPPKTAPEANQSKERLRGPDNAAAAPTRFQGKVMHSQGILFTWVDRAVDEDAYMIEVKAQTAPEYKVAALLDPNINSFGLITLPDEKVASYRVRAAYYGKPSNVEHKKTGPEPPATPRP